MIIVSKMANLSVRLLVDFHSNVRADSPVGDIKIKAATLQYFYQLIK